MADNSDVFVRFGADIDPLKKGVKEARSKLDQFGANTRKTANDLGKMAGAAALAGAAIGGKLVSDSLAAIDAQAKMAKQLGTTSVSISTLERATDRSGISMRNVETGVKNLEIALGEAAQGTGVAVDTLDRLGLSAENLQGLSLDEKIIKINSAIKENIPAAERAAAASDLFGKKASFAISQLDVGTIRTAKEEVVGFGVAVSDVDAAKIEAANDAMGNISLAVKGVSNQFTVSLAPVLEEIANDFKAAAIETGGFKEQGEAALEGIASAVGFVGNSFRGLEIAVGGGKLAFEGLVVAANIMATNIVEILDKAREGWVLIINEMIEMANNIPSVNIDLLEVGKSDLAESMRAGLEGAKEDLAKSAGELNDLLLQPLPSEQVEEYIASVRDKNDLLIQANKEKNEAIAADDEKANTDTLSREERTRRQLSELKKFWGRDDVTAGRKALGDLTTLMQSENKKQFEIGKAAARVNTVISTYEGAQKAYTALSGIPVVGPALGAAAAGAAIAAGGIRLQAINSTSFGGGGSVSAGAGTTAGGSAEATSAPQQASAPQQDRNLVISGVDAGSLYSGEQLLQLMDNINGAVEDGYTLKAS